MYLYNCVFVANTFFTYARLSLCLAGQYDSISCIKFMNRIYLITIEITYKILQSKIFLNRHEQMYDTAWFIIYVLT